MNATLDKGQALLMVKIRDQLIEDQSITIGPADLMICKMCFQHGKSFGEYSTPLVLNHFKTEHPTVHMSAQARVMEKVKKAFSDHQKDEMEAQGLKILEDAFTPTPQPTTSYLDDCIAKLIHSSHIADRSGTLCCTFDPFNTTSKEQMAQHFRTQHEGSAKHHGLFDDPPKPAEKMLENALQVYNPDGSLIKSTQMPAAYTVREKPKIALVKDRETINHPSHYGGDTTYEVIKVIQAWNLNFALGNVLKYVYRSDKKPGEDPIENLKKAKKYIEFEIEQLERERDLL